MDDLQWSVVNQIFDADKHLNVSADEVNYGSNCSSLLSDATLQQLVNPCTAPKVATPLNGAKAPMTAFEYAMATEGAGHLGRRSTGRGRNPSSRSARQSTVPSACNALTTQSVINSTATVDMSQLIYSDKLPESVGPGEALYAVVDGVAYEIVGGTSPDNGGISLADYGLGNAIIGNPVMGNTVISTSDGTIPQSLVSSDYQQISLSSGNLQTSATGSGDGMQIIILPPGENTTGNLTDTCGNFSNVQQVVLQPGQPLPPELRELIGADLPADLSGYQFIIGSSDGSNIANMSTMMTSSSNNFITGNSAANFTSITSGFSGYSVGNTVSSENNSDMLALLGANTPCNVNFQSPAVFSRTVLAEECIDDDEFQYVAAPDEDCGAPQNVTEAADLTAASSGYLGSYLGFVRGDKIETLSGVANSAILRRPPMPRYIPDLSTKPLTSTQTAPVPPVTVSLVYSDDTSASGTDGRLVVVPSSNQPSATARITVEKVDGRSVLRQSKLVPRKATSGVSTEQVIRSGRIVKRRKRSEDDSDEETVSNSEFSGNDTDSDAEDPAWKPSMDAEKRVSFAASTPAAAATTTGREHASRSNRAPRSKTAARRDSGSTAGAPASVSISTTPTGYVLQVGSDSHSSRYQELIPWNPNDPHHYQKGDFVIERKDLHKTEGFPIWKIEVGRLLQKFDPEILPDRTTIFKSASIYSSWSGNIRTTFKAIDTEVISGTGRRQEVVRVLPEYLPPPLDDSLEQDPLMDLFNVYVQSLVSQSLDPSFLSVLRQQKVDYYDGPLEQINNLLTSAQTAVLAQIQFTDGFKSVVDELPYYSLTTNIQPTAETFLCQASTTDEKATCLVELFGPVYSCDDLTNWTQQVQRGDAKRFAIGSTALELFSTYHALHHYKYLLYRKCLEEVVYIRHSKPATEAAEILAQCLQNRVWVQQLLRELKNLVQKCIVISVVDASEMPAVNEPSYESAPQTTCDTVYEAAQLACEPTVESQFEPAAESQFEPTVESQFEPAAESQFEPAAESQLEPAAESQFEPTVESQFEPAAESQLEPAAESLLESAAEPQYGPAVESQYEPTVESQFEPNEPVVAMTMDSLAEPLEPTLLSQFE